MPVDYSSWPNPPVCLTCPGVDVMPLEATMEPSGDDLVSILNCISIYKLHSSLKLWDKITDAEWLMGNLITVLHFHHTGLVPF